MTSKTVRDYRMVISGRELSINFLCAVCTTAPIARPTVQRPPTKKRHHAEKDSDLAGGALLGKSELPYSVCMATERPVNRAWPPAKAMRGPKPGGPMKLRPRAYLGPPLNTYPRAQGRQIGPPHERWTAPSHGIKALGNVLAGLAIH
jgi:hypothetical protein